MKTLIFSISLFIFAQSLFAKTEIMENLKPEDQKYFKNEAFSGMNKLERIDLNVKEINKLHGEIEGLKSEISKMKKDIEELKRK
jgi:hypothetical protein